MKIEEVINQVKPFRSCFAKAMVNLMFTSNWVEGHIKEVIKPFGLTTQQYNVLRILRGAGEPLSTSVIRSRLIDKMSDTSRMVDRLSKKGLLKRETCCGDRRLVDVSLTPEGEKILLDIDERADQFDICLCKLTAEDAKTLNELLDKIRT